MSEANSPERDYEKLSKAITEAVLSSEKVKQVVQDIRNRDSICAQSFMVLVLKLSNLTESLEMDTELETTAGQNDEEVELEEEGEPQAKPKKPKSPPAKKDSSQFIDGQKLSKKEIAFQEFISQQFDADEWLKKIGLKF